ncbi:subclass B1 metallo-beta-lactamase [Hymenobacter sp. BT18]|uniref:subclass B1 metallo-beta-lactamase n=1 Tax=Hymenobacter sp. BT18 TaxID=2835648 RepID=UPI00143E9AEB|nr:subclass B1 metallo-beta-lactamase [Hymenobacter sp. BT18]QIX62234.1 subclass B1 metallo-beta-lactamase [Hymenobacter sp. BT18]
MNFLLVLSLLAAVVSSGTHLPRASGSEKIVYQSATLTITQVAPNSYVHTSFLQTQTFGKVPCNGLVVKSGEESVVFDTPTGDPEARELLAWINGELHCRVKAVVPTHFHEDCVGGLPEFKRQHIPSYAHKKTIAYARQHQFHVPQRGFNGRLTLKVGTARVYVTFFGEGHTRDNVVGYFPADEVLFGGCLIKELQAGKGNLADANVPAWPATVARVKQAYPTVQVVVPGHGAVGGPDLLDYTIRLFQQP